MRETMNIEVEDLTEEQAKKILRQIIQGLDELDGEDYFGIDGWRHWLGLDDE